MGLSFTQKSDLNLAILDALRLRLLDKDESVIPFPGKHYDFLDPANQSIMGSIGQEPDPDFDGVQPPNSMGMVLLVSPDGEGRIECTLSGQFDLSWRYIPDLDVMVENLSREGARVKDTQPVVTSFRRMTVEFEGVGLKFMLPKDNGRWLVTGDDSPLQLALSQLESELLEDPRVFKVCEVGATGGAKFDFDWDTSIETQEALNRAVAASIFTDTEDLLRYQVRLRARARRAPGSLRGGEGAYLLEIYLENCTSRNTGRAFGILNPHLLDAQFTARLDAGEHHMLPHKIAPVDYRYEATNEVDGYGVTTSIKSVGHRTFATDAMPIDRQPRIENPESEDLGMTDKPTFGSLSTSPLNPLLSLAKAVDSYIDKWTDSLPGMEPDIRAESEQQLDQLKAERDAIGDGISLLQSDPDLLKCFSLMNEAMLNAIQLQGKNFDSWRLFQLGFILTQVRAVYERTCDEKELTDHLETAEVLWFSTGGGKTEAYLGIILMAMFWERMKGRHYGTSAWMRFPLRMLSVQQFQRLSYVVAQANMIRQREGFGGHPYTIGYFTGRGTPGHITSTRDYHKEWFLPSLNQEKLNELKFISDCPYCTESHTVEMKGDIDTGRIKHVCTNASCWSNTEADPGAYGEGIRGELGIYVSDEECYRYLPTVMVGTIDKLVVISHNKRFRGFFGGAKHFCPTHGFIFERSCHHSRIIKLDNGDYGSETCPNNSRTSQVKTVTPPPMLHPGISLLIQDELHLLKENTGNFDAHYETLFCALQEANEGRKPKVLAATATIKEYEHHVKHLYQRHARRFPVPGIELGESFYSRIVKGEEGNTQYRRTYAGILPIGSGQAMDKAAAHTSARYLTLVDDLRAQFVSDPGASATSLGFEASQAPQLLSHIETFLNANLIYVNSFRSLSDVIQSLEEAQGDFPDRQYRQLSGKSTLEEIQNTIDLIETKSPDDETRQVVATSVVSHGVDMHRLNFMVITGWPKSMAEYMQSSARAGRIEPGIVLSVLNSKVLFQSNVFMDFKDYHKFMDRMVESVPVNRFAPNLLERTLPGIITAWINNWAPGQPDPWGMDITKSAGKVKQALRDPAHMARNELKNHILSSMAVPDHLKDSFDERVVSDFTVSLERHVDHALKLLEGMTTDIAEDFLSDAIERLLGNRPMQSLRDIESQVRVMPQTELAGRVLESLSR